MRDIGLDIHRDFREVAVVEAVEVRSAGRIKTTPESLELGVATHLERHPVIATEALSEVVDEPRHLAAADVEIMAPSDPICPSSIPLLLPRPLRRVSTRTRSSSSSRYSSTSARTCSQDWPTP